MLAPVKLSAQEEYGIRCLLQLARQDGSVTVAEVGAKEGLGEPYVAKLLRVLRQAGLVESIRGKNGGYLLARPADQIRMSEVISALGSELYSPQHFCERFAGDRSVCVHSCECSLRSLWEGIQGVVHTLLERCTLAELVNSEQDMRTWVGTQLASIAAELSVNSTRRGTLPTRP